MLAVALSIKEIAGAGTQTGKKNLYNLHIQKRFKVACQCSV